MMHVGKSTLSAACKDTYGMSVIQLMRQVRLEQCRMALIKPERTTTVRSVMAKYRFTNQNRFAKAYKEAFAELPSETYMRGQGLKLQGLAKPRADSSESSRPIDLSPKLRQSDLSPPCSSPTSLPLTCTSGVDLHKNYGFVGVDPKHTEPYNSGVSPFDHVTPLATSEDAWLAVSQEVETIADKFCEARSLCVYLAEGMGGLELDPDHRAAVRTLADNLSSMQMQLRQT